MNSFKSKGAKSPKMFLKFTFLSSCSEECNPTTVKKVQISVQNGGRTKNDKNMLNRAAGEQDDDISARVCFYPSSNLLRCASSKKILLIKTLLFLYKLQKL